MFAAFRARAAHLFDGFLLRSYGWLLAHTPGGRKARVTVRHRRTGEVGQRHVEVEFTHPWTGERGTWTLRGPGFLVAAGMVELSKALSP